VKARKPSPPLDLLRAGRPLQLRPAGALDPCGGRMARRAQRQLDRSIGQSPRVAAQRQQLASLFGGAASPARPVAQRVPPSGKDWEAVNKVVSKLREQRWVKSAFPVAQGSQVALKDINSDGICRTIVLEWFRQTKARKREDYLEKFQSGEVDDLVEQDQEFFKQHAIHAARDAPNAPPKEQLERARRYVTEYMSVGGNLMQRVIEDGNPSSQAIVDAISSDGFYYVIVDWTADEALHSHALGVIKNGSDYYFLDPNHQEIQGTSAVLDWLKGILDTTYGPEKKTKPGYGLLYAQGTIDNQCFLTTAAVRARGLADDCEELQTLRRFRDGYLRQREDGEAAIRHYRAVAPRVLAALARREDEDEVLEAIYGVIARCVVLIHRGRHARAFKRYRGMVRQLEALL
jgi:hypothetical protein